eukprot:scaffold175677_cov42-Cyclotella_meneghiniana.AAC.1
MDCHEWQCTHARMLASGSFHCDDCLQHHIRGSSSSSNSHSTSGCWADAGWHRIHPVAGTAAVATGLDIHVPVLGSHHVLVRVLCRHHVLLADIL